MPQVSTSTDNELVSEYGTTIREAAYITSNDDPTFMLGVIAPNDDAAHLARAIQSVSVSYSMDMCPQVTVQLFDVNMKMLENNYFNIGRGFVYKSSERQPFSEAEFLSAMQNSPNSQTIAAPSLGETGLGYAVRFMELASLSVQPGQGSSPSITLELRSAPIMEMKRDRKPGSIKGSGHVFVQQAAELYGLRFYTETTKKDKKINKASSDRRADSLWDVLSSLASESKFSIFEVNGILVFASMRNLFGRWGAEQFDANVIDERTNQRVRRKMNSWYVHYPYLGFGQYGNVNRITIGDVANNSALSRTLIPLQCPTFRRSDSDIYQVEGSLSLDRHSAMVLRPGMTIYVDGVPTFEDFYIITDVSFEHMSTNPVQVSFRKPEREDKYIQDLPVGLISGSGSSVWGE